MGEFYKVFKLLRQERGYFRAYLSDVPDISRSIIGMCENGDREPDFETLEKIADFFQIDADYLLGHTKVPTVLAEKQTYEPTYEDIQSLVARSGKKLTVEQRQDITRILLSDGQGVNRLGSWWDIV